MRRILLPVLVVALLGTSCFGGFGRRTLVAALYPLAYAAEQLAEARWDVVNLTPPGAEAHDLELSLEDRAAIEGADVVVYLGQIGFQPQVEAAVREADGRILDLSGELEVAPGVIDPHVWLEPSMFGTVVNYIGSELCPSEDPCSGEPTPQADLFQERLAELMRSYFFGLRDCRYDTLIASHEAFGHVTAFHGLRQIGLTGLSPEAEPSVERLAEAERVVAEGDAGAIFFELDTESRRVAETFAADVGVPALPLHTLEAQPPEGDYLSVLEDNLESLREGLECR